MFNHSPDSCHDGADLFLLSSTPLVEPEAEHHIYTIRDFDFYIFQIPKSTERKTRIDDVMSPRYDTDMTSSD